MTFKPGDKVGLNGSDRVYTVVAVFPTLVRIQRESGHVQYVPSNALTKLQEAPK